jgi:hypothetical protein
MLYLLSIEGGDFLQYAFFLIIALVIWFMLLRWAVRADSIVRNQELIIHIMIQQYKKQGATDEEIQNMKTHLGIQ